MDINAYTRGRTLKTWGLLATNQAIPLRYISAVTNLAVNRLADKAAVVRKHAIQVQFSLPIHIYIQLSLNLTDL